MCFYFLTFIGSNIVRPYKVGVPCNNMPIYYFLGMTLVLRTRRCLERCRSRRRISYMVGTTFLCQCPRNIQKKRLCKRPGAGFKVMRTALYYDVHHRVCLTADGPSRRMKFPPAPLPARTGPARTVAAVPPYPHPALPVVPSPSPPRPLPPLNIPPW